MDKEKTERLKKVLDQTISSEEIAKKLKEEKAKQALDNLRTRSEEPNQNVEQETKKVQPKVQTQEKEEKKPSKVEEKKEDENKSLNITIILASILALLLLIVAIYIFTKDDINQEINVSNEKPKSISKEEVVVTPKLKETAVLKPLQEKEDSLVKKNIETKEEKPLDEIKEDIKKETEEKVKVEEVVKTKEVIKEVVVTKVINLEKNNFKEFYNSLKYNTLKCYNFKAGDVFPDSKCKADLKKFLNKHSNAIRFEIIPVIAQDDNILFDKMKNNIKDMEQKFQDRVKEYMFRGLSRERVLETSWQIKETLGEDVVLTPTNYYVKSKKNNKGIIIKAYH